MPVVPLSFTLTSAMIMMLVEKAATHFPEINPIHILLNQRRAHMVEDRGVAVKTSLD